MPNHLGNVIAVLSDKKLGTPGNRTLDVLSMQDYYPFGMPMEGRYGLIAGGMKSGYRYGFNGKENDNEVKGEGNQQDYGMRIYDGRLGRFLSVDPITKQYPELTPYQFASNTPVWAIDLDGLEMEPFQSMRAEQKQRENRANMTPEELKRDKQLELQIGIGVSALPIAIYGAIVAAPVLTTASVATVNIATTATTSSLVWASQNPMVVQEGVNFVLGIINPTPEDINPNSSTDEVGKVIGQTARKVGNTLASKVASNGVELLSAFKEKLPNSFKGIDKIHLDAAIGDMRGNPVVNSITGYVYDHLDDISGHMRSLNGKIKDLNKLINSGSFTDEVLEEAQGLRSSLQKQYDSYQAALTRAANETNTKLDLKKRK